MEPPGGTGLAVYPGY